MINAAQQCNSPMYPCMCGMARCCMAWYVMACMYLQYLCMWACDVNLSIYLITRASKDVCIYICVNVCMYDLCLCKGVCMQCKYTNICRSINASDPNTYGFGTYGMSCQVRSCHASFNAISCLNGCMLYVCMYVWNEVATSVISQRVEYKHFLDRAKFLPRTTP